MKAERVPKMTLNHECPEPKNVKTKRKRHIEKSVLRYFWNDFQCQKLSTKA